MNRVRTRLLSPSRPWYRFLSRGPDKSPPPTPLQDLILNVFENHPSSRDSRFYLKHFTPTEGPSSSAQASRPAFPIGVEEHTPTTAFGPQIDTFLQQQQKKRAPGASLRQKPVEFLPEKRQLSLVKLQLPFSRLQLTSIAEGLVHLNKLGLSSIVVIDDPSWESREEMRSATLLFVEILASLRAHSRPFLSGVLKEDDIGELIIDETQVDVMKDALEKGEILVIPPLALSEGMRMVHVNANQTLFSICEGLVSESSLPDPLRLMIIAKEGGIPSHARAGDPHMSINLASEYSWIKDTFTWHDTHSFALENLELTRKCLALLPRTASGIFVSHRSPRSLISNLITNKPAHSPSLDPSLLPRFGREHLPTIVREGSPIHVVRQWDLIDEDKLTNTLEQSFGKQLDREAYFGRIVPILDCVIIAGDYDGVAIVTNEGSQPPIAYLDKFAVLPKCQGDGTVDFLWSALRDETFGLGLLDALNPHGGFGGHGEPRDLVWRSRVENPVNKWYFDRSSGYIKIPQTTGQAFSLFWCRALLNPAHRLSFADELAYWISQIAPIKSCWI